MSKSNFIHWSLPITQLELVEDWKFIIHHLTLETDRLELFIDDPLHMPCSLPFGSWMIQLNIGSTVTLD